MMALFSLSLPLLLLLEAEKRRKFRIRRRELRDAANPLEMPEDRFQYLFRISREIGHALCVALVGRLQTRRSNGIPVPVQVLAAIRFYATGSYQANIDQDGAISLSESNIRRCVRIVSRAIHTDLLQQWIKFPRTEPERQAIIERFFVTRNFPCVLGCIDCIHVAIAKPRKEDQSFMNRHFYHTLNVQMVCDQDLRILSCCAKYPGEVDDQCIFESSRVKGEMVRLHTNGDRVWLLGDSGYSLEPFLLTPIRDAAEDSPEGRYTKAHCRTRNCIQRAFGVLKTRWRCLQRRRVLKVSPGHAIMIIHSCVALHNMIVQHGLPLPEILDEEPLHDVPQPVRQRTRDGIEARQRLVLEYFQQ